ncbi:S-DNA-T family DNA segregation ATPase FtsK/SpoIIIE [Mesoflavibacter sabulilitoris]|uniref:Cell division protein FtsK n=1 Tax=Mesoflavibacter zeaxanthinifaciens subsp. sabulilitoris TaxID=1520893 RepID=A0A2T1NH07_9FLAO|nr:DNA translocase FtsK [Mesoflavibacter zeaxanthinifaciens]MBB3122755.1 S-DNA-T family DNA segregation ATPase FtsK/SpoIIIE [Mesoflavibacter zeaxanthinifaciens subsp. sabulilitoris]PSG92159.1 cell division protein FtsK [Mesoflavibacter zeaxanthinifaciens subsp. sabulilitoris]
MAKAKKTSKTKNKSRFKKPDFTLNNQQKLVLGSFLVILGFLLFTAFLSFIFTGKADQSALSEFTTRDVETQNWLSKVGAWLSDVFIQRGFGIASFIFSGLTFLSGVFVLMDLSKTKLRRHWFWGTLIIIWFSILFGFFTSKNDILSGTIGFEVNTFFQDYIGKLGTVLLLIFAFITYLAVRFKFTPQRIASLFNKAKAEIKDDLKEDFTPVDNSHSEEAENIKSAFEVNKDVEPTITNHSTTETSTTFEVSTPKDEEEVEEPILKTSIKEENGEGDVKIEVETVKEEESETDNLANKLVEDFGQFDPTLELGKYQYPPLDLLKKYDNEGVTINQQELEENKNRIVETLNNYKIGIDSIKATIGPTVTLYEIVPEAGVRISKIKNLEDDIALSLAALGIRIIAPIPGKGTIGIEVPNKNSTIVSMRSVIASQKFQKSEMQLPIAIGKTISNETLVIDLAKMPHLLMAGATGQGKSVGLNAVLTSLLYKKHPAEVKFVLVDPKKVELTLFNKIERHYLAKLPDSEDAIITDNTKVINTLNSLCIEMDNRYELLKNALCRNISEYNAKFKARKLNPNDGHQFLPYIVLVVDEFADLIMTAGKEVETPIARLAQLARAIGIHLIIATQRPSVNVITGIIKANFPARIAFRVTSKIDSRTILDGAGADQLIGRGDMLYTQGNDMIRIQCAFVDTPEVEKIVDFIGAQKAYPDAYLLPEYVGEESGTSLDIDISDRDKLFREAAEIIVTAQQGSASLLQRKLKLGYNRAGRIIDQLEAAGIVGGFEGSKARQVLVPDLLALEQLLENETK